MPKSHDRVADADLLRREEDMGIATTTVPSEKSSSTPTASVQRSPSQSTPSARSVQMKNQVRGMSFDEAEAALAPVQAKEGNVRESGPQAIAARGVAGGGGGALPYADKIQRSFGRHDVGNVQAHVGGAAREATGALGASAYATGSDVAFASAPDLHTAAHEAAHVVQQRAGVSLYGGVGQAGDVYEQHADAVADQVVQGKSAEGLLDKYAGSGGGAAASQAGPVQMYTRVPASKQKQEFWNAGVDLRVADDGKMAVADATHQMWATTDIIAHSDNVLIGQKSPFSVTVGSGTLKGPSPSVKKGVPQELHEVVPMNYNNGTVGDEMRTIEACSSHGQELMGSGVGQGEHGMAKGMSIVTKNGNGEDERKYDKRGMSGQGRTDANIVTEVRSEMTGEQDKGESQKAYAKMSDKEKGKKAKELGVNQYAEPEVGEGLAVYSAVDKLVKPGSFPMHFAPVIARSAGDYVTLENYAKVTGKDRKQGDTNDSSNDWYFKMFGPVKKGDDQSFFGEIAKQGDYGGKKGTMVLKHRLSEGFAETQEVQDGNEVWAKCNLWARTFVAKQYPSFAAAWPKFCSAHRAAQKEMTQAWIEERAPSDDIMQRLAQAILDLKQVQACQDLMNDQQPTPEVADQTPVQQPLNQPTTTDDIDSSDSLEDDQKKKQDTN